MAFANTYISTTYKTAHADDTRIVLSDDAYALGEIIELLTVKLQNLIK